MTTGDQERDQLRNETRAHGRLAQRLSRSIKYDNLRIEDRSNRRAMGRGSVEVNGMTDRSSTGRAYRGGPRD
jgi:hypothetical protein